MAIGFVDKEGAMCGVNKVFGVVVRSTIDGFKESCQQEFEEMIRHMILALSSTFFIDISCLNDVIVTDDYGHDIENFYREGMNRSSPTKNEFGIGVAMTMPFKVEGAVKVNMFFDLNFMIKCMKSEYGQKSLIHYVHHELCHVEDIYFKSKNLKEFLSEKIHGADIYLQRFAETMWDEYYAHRRSAPTINDEDFYDLQGMVRLISSVKPMVNENIKGYRFDADLDGLMSGCMGYIGQSLGCMARVAGNVHGGSKNFSVTHQETGVDPLALDDYNIYSRAELCLDVMYCKYDTWKSVEIYSQLKEIVNDYLKYMGFYLETTEDNQLYVSIPFRADNMPI